MSHFQPPFSFLGQRPLLRLRSLLVFLVIGWLTACGGPLVGVTVVDERTALENQVLGT